MIDGKILMDKAAEEAIKANMAGDTSLASRVTVLEGIAQDLQYKVPSAPEVAGTYVLKATVASDLSVTFAWVSAE